jgi:hypothetical protein
MRALRSPFLTMLQILLAIAGASGAGHRHQHQSQRQHQHQQTLVAEREAPDKPEPSADLPFAGMFRSHRDTHMNAFDFDAVHADPDTMSGSRLQLPPGPTPEAASGSGSETGKLVMDPMQALPRDLEIQHQAQDTKILQQYWTGAKAEGDDCPTWPYCNHVPAPPPLMPPPQLMKVIDHNVWYPWMERYPFEKPGNGAGTQVQERIAQMQRKAVANAADINGNMYDVGQRYSGNIYNRYPFYNAGGGKGFKKMSHRDSIHISYPALGLTADPEASYKGELRPERPPNGWYEPAAEERYGSEGGKTAGGSGGPGLMTKDFKPTIDTKGGVLDPEVATKWKDELSNGAVNKSPTTILHDGTPADKIGPGQKSEAPRAPESTYQIAIPPDAPNGASSAVASEEKNEVSEEKEKEELKDTLGSQGTKARRLLRRR